MFLHKAGAKVRFFFVPTNICPCFVHLLSAICPFLTDKPF